MIAPCLFITETDMKGRGVFSSADITKNSVVEIAPVIVMSGEERQLLDQTLLHDYIFEWGDDTKQCCLALGWVSVYNHSYKSNCEYDMDYDDKTITIKTTRKIKAGEELTINYNGTWNNEKKVWFDAE
ncbi:MAG: SET domain-containing protein-lysine N-methyltransferase [Sphingobacteriales bacterium 41-5]|nr:MAG: SET domain-containing protein-lysine N-methyltransferase [Sphingobacteriales bacterium 41-5]